jgi:hypothetical protein
MKYFSLLAFLGILFSCQKKENGYAYKDTIYSVDTIIIDSRNRLLDLDTYIFKSDLNNEENSIFLYNKFDHSIDEVNLDDYEFVKSFPFETEGPNGTGKHVNNLNILVEDLIFFKSFGRSAVFHKSGSLEKRIEWENAIDSNGLKYGEIPQNEVAIGTSDLKVFGLNYDQKNVNVFLDVLSVQDNSVKRIDFDSEKSYQNFVFKIDDPANYTYLDPIIFLAHENDFILVSHQFSNEIYLFNSEGKQVQTVNYEPKMTPKRAKDLSGKKITSYEQIQDEYQSLLEQVRFGPPVWDREKKRYFRLSTSMVFSDSSKEEDSFLPEIKEAKVYLSIFDTDFNLISELIIPELSNQYVKYFAKDGKLWVFKNYSDELGFIVIDI